MSHGITHQKKHAKGANGRTKVIKELQFAEDGEFYAIISAVKGDGRFEVTDYNGRVLKASAPRSFKKGPRKEMIRLGNTVKIQEGISKDQFFVNHLYTDEDVQSLINYNEIKINTSKSSLEVDNMDTSDIQFDYNVTMDDIANI